MIIVFDKLLLECIHDPNLHNRCQEDKLRSLPSNLLTSFADYNDKTFKEINKQRNCHFADYGAKTKITNFFEEYAKTNEVKLFVSYANLYQIAIPNTEIRLIGDLRCNYFHSKEKAYNDLFSILFLDFEHSLHPRKKAKNNLVCVMKTKDC